LRSGFALWRCRAEYNYLRAGAGLLDLSFRSRICVTRTDRVRFLHGQVTNDIRALKQGQGCYAALITAKGKMESDLIVYALEEELLLDFEPGLTAKVSERLEKYIIADDVQLIDVSPHYGLLSVQGPMSDAALAKAGFVVPMDTSRFSFRPLRRNVCLQEPQNRL
jgi:folate-binding Fe-S cluster repair protein YgfZ